jgi:nascent polypeptide-associated complex subunit alpha
MIPGMKQSDLKKAMKRMGVKQEEIDAQEVIIKTKDKNLVISNPSVVKIEMMGQESFQVSGEVSEQGAVSQEDVNTVMEKASVSEEEARKALEKTSGDLAGAILSLKS